MPSRTAKKATKRVPAKKATRRTATQLKCPECGRKCETATGLGRHRAFAHPDTWEPSASTLRTRSRSTNGNGTARRTRVHLIEAYLDEVQSGKSGKPRTQVSLKGIDGFPVWTKDPEVIEAAIGKLQELAKAETNSLARLNLLAREQTVKEALAELTGESGRVHDFIRYGKAYADNRHIPYGAFRSFGVRPDVLEAAGIEPS